MIRLRLSIALFAITPGAMLADEGRAPSSAEVQRWIGQLGDDAYRTREAAMHQLVKAGLAARPAVQKALEDQDAEIRLRCQQILALIEQREEQRILQAFLDEKDPDKDHGLAGWKEFRAIAGDSSATRSFYAELHKAERPLLRAMARGSKELSELFASRLAELQQLLNVPAPASTQRRVPLVSATALLFVATDSNVSLANQNIHFLIYQSEIHQQLNSGKHIDSEQRDMLRKLLARFIRREADATVMYQNLHLALRFELKEGLGPAAKLATNEKATAVYRLYALLVVAKFGAREDSKAIEPLLADATVVYTRPAGRTAQPFTTQLRDAALAATIHLHGGKLEEFGFNARPHPQLLYLPYSLGFAADEQREAAFNKFREWQKTRPEGE